MSEEPTGSTRIGHAERDSAMHALDVHLSAGRLDAEEYGERAGRISVARTAAELTPLFADLPAPHPVISATPAADDARAAGIAAATGSPAVTVPRVAPDRKGREALGGKVGETVVGLSPFIALALFFLTDDFFDSAWIFFLLVPAAGAIVYGRNWRGE